MSDVDQADPTHGNSLSGPAALAPLPRNGPLPLSSGQERLLFIEEYDPNTARWNLHFARRWKGRLDTPALENALNELTARHEALRTTFSTEQTQVIAAPVARRLPVVDVSATTDPAAEAARRARAELDVPFDVHKGPLFRTTLFRLHEDEHVLLLTMHHAVSDGLSFEVMEGELLALYDAFRNGRPSTLDAPELQYADYAVWHRQWAAGRADRQLTFWKKQLEGASNLDFPIDRPRPAKQSFVGSSHGLEIPASLAAAVSAFSRAERVTTFMTLQAAFLALVARYSGQNDICVGTPVANRPRAELASVVGFFVNRLVLRTDLSGEPTARELVRRVRTTSLTAYANQDVSFERVVEAVRPVRDPSRAPLAQVMFSGFTVSPRKPIDGITLDWFNVNWTVAHYDVGLVIDESAGALRATFEWNVELFEPSTIARFAEHYLRLLEGMVAHPDVPVGTLPILGSSERDRILVEFNSATPSPPHAHTFVHEMIRQQAAKTPEALALTDATTSLTYAELEATTNRLARLLRRRGVTTETRVLVALERSAANVIARIAILKAGGAFAPVDVAQPLDRTVFMIRESGAPIVVTATKVKLEAAVGVQCVELDSPSVVEALSRESAEPLALRCFERQLAYVIFTSGTTGRPKAAMVEHRSFANMVDQHRRLAEMTPNDRTTHMAGPAFDATTNEIWPPLTAGAALFVVSDEIRGNPRDLVRWLSDRKITVAHMTTPLAELALDEDWSESALRTLFTGGQALTKRPRGTEPFRLINIYGPTEATDYVTFEVEAPGQGPVTTIGKPIQHAAIYLLDGTGAPAAIGVYGELYIGGTPVGRGYVGRPELTAEKFVPDPFAADAGRRMYRTGDFARWLPDGTLEFRGRRDDQVKLRGFRIELGEIEAALKEHERVRASAVIVREDAPDDKRLVAYVVGRNGVIPTDELRKYLAQTLPEYMIPSAFVTLAALPLTRNGKVDRAALPAPDESALRRSAYVEPRTPIEAVLVSIWSDVLNVERVSPLDDFFELGGHSMLAMRVVSRVRRDLAVKLPVSALFEAKTIRALGTFLDAQKRTIEELPIEPVPRTGPLAMSFAQERLWFLDQYDPNTATFNLPYVLRWSGPLDVGVLVRALDALAERHESLRTTFSAEGGVPSQRVAPPGPHAHTIVDVRDDRDPEAEARRLTTIEASRPFDLAAGPLFRSVVIRVGDDESLLVFAMHHAIADGWSIALLHDELVALYGAFQRGEPSPLPPLALQYADFAAWQRGWLEGAVLKEQIAFWKDELAGAPALELPSDRPRPPVRSSRGKTHTFVVPEKLTRKLMALTRREGVSAFMAVYAAYAALLGRMSQQTDLTIGVPVANRSRVDLEPMVGFFVNNLPLRIDLSGGPTVRQLLGRVRKKTLALYAHQDVPFERLVDELRVSRDTSRTPIFQVHVGVDDDIGDFVASPVGVVLRSTEVEVGISKLDLALQVRAGATSMTVDLAYSTDLFDAVTIERLSERFLCLLEGMTGKPDAVVDDLSVIGERERQQLLQWSSPRTAPAWSDDSLHGLVSAQAALTPGALALADATSSLTYRELEARSTALAKRLLARGVERGDVVALLLPRDVNTIVAILAVLKAGAAYLPIDPALPEARIRYILDDSAARLALGSEELATGPLSTRLVTLSTVQAGKAAQGTLPAVAERDLAYIIYTSGSTGVPKGACIEHRSIVALAREQVSSRGLGAGIRHAQYASLAFDAHVSEVWPALVSGSSLHLCPDATRADARAIVEWFAHEGVHWAFIPTQVGEDCLRGDWPTVKLVGLGVGGDTFHGVPRRSYSFDVLNVYGPTECTCVTSSAVISPGDSRPSIGRPIGGVQVYVMSDGNELVTAGSVGEICIGGDQVGRGYLRRPDLTAERFTPDPFSNQSGARLYRTGDLGRWRGDGTLEHVGRMDHQVKVRGFRIELGEIEAALAEVPEVRDSVVVVREDEPGDKRVVAYVVGREPAPTSINVGDVRSALKEKLPDYMVPSAIVTLPAFELDARTGKVNRQKLPAPDATALVTADYVAPEGPIEIQLAEIWAEVLELPRVGAEDDFFSLGGHSLIAVRVIARVRRALGVDLPVRELFTNPTLRALARTVTEVKPAEKELPGIKTVSRDGPLSLSFTQERLWFLTQLDPNSYAYNLPTSVRLTGKLDSSSLERAFRELLRRHEVLRTAIVARDGQPTQAIQPVPEVALSIADRSGATEAEIQAIVDEEVRAPFDLTISPFRALLVRLGPEEHLLITTIHHVASDGWSRSVVERELSVLYEAFVTGKASPLAPLPIQFADYAAWQRAQMTTSRASDDIAYWQKHLAGAPPALDLPTDRPYGPVQSYRGEVETAVLSRELTRALNEAARTTGASLFMTMLAAYTLVLSRHSGQDDVVVGVPIAERSRPELESLIGLLLNTVAMRMSVSGDPTFRELVDRARETSLAGYAHQDVPFEKLLDELVVERNLARTPIFQVMLVSTKFDADAAFSLHGLSATASETTVAAKCDATLYFDDDSGELKLWLVYAAEVFDRVRMRDMLAQIVAVLEQAVERPTTPVDSFLLVTARGRQVLPDAAMALDTTWRGAVTEVFAARASRGPERLAVTDATDTWSYGELNARSNQLAHKLLSAGVQRGERIAIFAHRSASLVCAVLGVLKAGAAFVMLDPAYPPERVVTLLEASGARGLIRIAAGSVLPELAAKWVMESDLRVRLDLPRKQGLGALLDSEPITPPSFSLSADDLAYVAFTSGSTGVPKGVLGRHGPLTHFHPWLCSEFGLSGDDRFTMLSGLAHDPLHRDMFTPLQLGASIHILATEEITAPGRLAAWMTSERVTVAHMTPAFGQLLTDSADTLSHEGQQPCIDSLRRVFLVGDVLTKRDVDRMRAIAPNLMCVNYYGSTETQRAVSYHVVVESDRGSLPLGRGMPGVQLLVVNKAGTLAGIGEIGELVFRSPHLAKGYINDAELSAAKFVPNPLGQRFERDRAYRTGDLGRYLPSGEAVFAGRADRQVKIRGFRVEPSEIETTLQAHPALREVVVIAREDVPGDKRLVAYLVGKHGIAMPGSDELRDLVGKRLPDYMVPSAFVTLDALPVTPNGKLDRAALPAPKTEHAEDEHAAPRGGVEDILATQWRDVLGLSKVSATDNFFALGGNSLLAVRLVARVRRDLGVELPVRTFFTAPSIRALASVVEKEKGKSSIFDAFPLTPAPRDARPELSFTQERLWFLSRLDPDSTAYTIRAGVRMAGDLDVAALEKSVTEVVRRHDILRLTVVDLGTHPSVVVSQPKSVPLQPADATGLDDDELARRIDAEFSRPFDLAVSPVRFALMRVNEREHILLATMHHIVADGWSVQVFYRDLFRLYEAFASGKPSPLEPLPLQFTDYAAWQRKAMGGDVAKASLGYWLDHLAGAPPALALPTDRPFSIVRSGRAETETIVLPPQVTRALQDLGRTAGASTFMSILAAFGLVLARQSGQDEVVVGVPVAHRPTAELENLVGLFLNTLALKVSIANNPSFRELLIQARETSLAGYAHQDVPFETIVEHLHPERSLLRTPVFQVLLVNFNFPKEPQTIAGLTVRPVELPDPASKFDIAFYIDESGDRLMLSFAYAADFFDRARMKELLAELGVLVRRAVEAPDTPVKAISLLTPESTALLPDPTAPLDDTWHGSVADVFAHAAARTPDRLAVTDAKERWTYAELDTRSNQLAHRLLKAGCAKGDPVAILADRSASLPWAVFGVLKAGCAFVILDPAYPAPRLVAILDAAKPRAVVRVTSDTPVAAEVEAWLASHDLRDRIDLAPKSAIGAAFDAHPTTKPNVVVTADDLAYVAFTSGSTGKPKGILGRHGPLSHFHPWRCREFGFTADDRFSMLSGLAHDPLHRDLFTPLQLGASLHILDSNEIMSPGRLASWMATEGISVTHLTPAFAQLITETAEKGVRLSALKHAFLVGDALTRRDVARLKRIAPSIRCVNYYGATETQQSLAYYVVPPFGGHEARPDVASSDNNSVVPIGRGTPGVQLLVLNPAGQLAAVGELGEIYFRTPHLSRGYLDDPELSTARFISNPFCPGASNDRLYRTGDLGRYDVRGDVVFAGRADRQVKIRGFRVELTEIESVLAKHEAVRDVAVILREDEPGDRRLVAYVALQASATVSGSALREAVAKDLPNYMVPAAVVKLPTLPLTPNGKLDRNALPSPDDVVDDSAEGEADASDEPTSTLEKVVAQIWMNVLGVSRVGRNDDYFELGGHSLNAMQVIARLRQDLGVEVPLRKIFMASTLSALAEVLEGMPVRVAAEAATDAAPQVATDAEAADAPLPLVPVSRDTITLSLTQERLWFLTQLEPNSRAYTLPWGVRLTGDLSLAALEKTVQEIVHRHEILRMTLEDRKGEPVVRITPPAPFKLPLIDMSGASTEEIQRRVDEEFGATFDLSKSPVRFALIRAGERDHRLLAAIHHIVADGWSVSVLNREVAALYSAFKAGEASPLAPLPLQFFDYAAWQRASLEAVGAQKRLDFWSEHLAGAPPTIDLPTDRPFAQVENRRSEDEDVVFSKELTRALNELARDVGASTFMTVLAAFSLVLVRHSGQEDVVIGLPVSHRPAAALEETIGLFLNTLALKMTVAGDPTFRELLAQARDTSLAGMAHMDVPFEKVVEQVNPERSLIRSPIFQIFMVAQPASARSSTIADLEVEPVALPPVASKFDITLYVHDVADESLRLTLNYASDFFDRARMKELLSQLTTVLTRAIEQPDAPVKSLSLVTAASRKLLPDPALPLPPLPQVPIFKTALEWGVRSPEKPALEWGELRWTSGELREHAGAIASTLSAAGIRRGTRVVVTGTRSPGLIAAMLAAWSVGAVVVPMSGEQMPDERRLLMSSEAQASLAIVVGAETMAWDVPTLEIDPRTAEIIGDLPSCGDGAAEPEEPTEIDPAYVFFTSGTTGKPKGVLGQHRGLAHFLRWQREQFKIGPGDRAAQLTGLGFNVVMRDIFTPITAGATLCIPPEPLEMMTPADSFRWLKDNNITIMHSVASVMTSYLAQWETDEQLPDLRVIFMAGEPLNDVLVHRMRAQFPNVRIINLYGQTESTLAKCFYEVPQQPKVGIQPVGRTLPQCQVLLLNEANILCGVGEPGEIVMRTPYRTLGYLNEERTSKAFQPNPLAGPDRAPDDIVYRTGDRGRYRVDGTLEIIGRVDDQVKILGVRVEPAEVAAALMEHPGVGQCFVRAFKDPQGNNVLAAYVVLPGTPWLPDEAELRGHLVARLPRAFIPTVFIVLESMPLSANGKVNRKALPEPVIGAGRDVVPPRTPLEETIAAIWKKVLKVDNISVHDDYFALGGHSLNAMQLMARIGTEVGVTLQLRTIFEAPTVAGLAGEVEKRLGATGDAPLDPPDIVRLPDSTALVPAYSQEMLKAWEARRAPSGTWNNILRLRLRGPLDKKALKEAIAALLMRQDALRVGYHAEHGIRMLATDDIQLDVVDMRSASDADVAAFADQQNNHIPFLFDGSPLIRFFLLEREAELHELDIAFHAVLHDPTRASFLGQQLMAEYRAIAHGAPPPPAPSIRYLDFAVWERAWFEGPGRREVEAARAALLGGGLQPIDISDRPRKDPVSTAGINRMIPPNAKAFIQVDAIARAAATSHFTVFVAVTAIALSRWSGVEEVGFLAPVNMSKLRPEFDGLAGRFFNLAFLRLSLAGAPTVAEMVNRAKKAVVEAHKYDAVPIASIFDHDDAFTSPLGRFALNTPMIADAKTPTTKTAAQEPAKAPVVAPPEPGQLIVEELPFDMRSGARNDLAIVLASTNSNKVFGQLRGSESLFHPETIERQCAELTRMLEMLDGDVPISRLSRS